MDEQNTGPNTGPDSWQNNPPQNSSPNTSSPQDGVPSTSPPALPPFQAPPAPAAPMFLPPAAQPPAKSGRSKGCMIVGVIAAIGIVIVGGIIAAVIAFFGFQQSTASDTVPSTAELGECYHRDNQDQLPVPCNEVHHFEVYSLIEFADSAGYPSNLERLLGAETCEADFETFTGEDYIESDLDYSVIYPTEAAWDAGDRVAACALHDFTVSEIVGSKGR